MSVPILSRVAEAFYWINRYVERAESYARFLEANQSIHLDMGHSRNEQWYPLIQTMGDQEAFTDRYQGATANSTIHFMAFDRENPNSIVSCLDQVKWNSRSVREMVSQELYEHITLFHQMVAIAEAKYSNNEADDFFGLVKFYASAFEGIMEASMLHSTGWHFGRMGRYIERADKTTRLLDMKYFIILPEGHAVGSALDILQWTSILKSISGFIAFQRRRTALSAFHIARFLLLDPEFPRSLRYCLNNIVQSLAYISVEHEHARELVGRARSFQRELDILNMEQIFQTGLHEYLDETQRELNELHRQIHSCFNLDQH